MACYAKRGLHPGKGKVALVVALFGKSRISSGCVPRDGQEVLPWVWRVQDIEKRVLTCR
jgi:hypothetical protein